MLVIKSLLILCSAAIVLAARSGTRAVVSGAIFVGEDATDPGATPLEIFEDPANHASAVSSVLVFSAKQSDFSPATQPPKSLVSTFEGFIEKASTFPGFVLERSEESSLPLDGSLFQFEKAIRDDNPNYYHQARVARSLRDLIPGYIVEEDVVNEWVLSLIVLDRHYDSDTIKVGLVSVTLSIESDDSSTASIPKQQAKVVTSVLKTNQSFLTSYAERLSTSIPIVGVRDFLDFFASPKVEEDVYRTIAATPCHKNTAFVNQSQRSLYNWQNGV